MNEGQDPVRAGADRVRAGAAPDRDDDAVYRFIERFSSILAEAGFPRMPARVFVALLASDSGLLTAAQLAELLHASPAAVSGGVRYLLQVGLVSSEREPGSRRLSYRMPGDVWYEVLRIRDRMLLRWAGVLREGIETLGASTPAGLRMTESVRYFEFVATELPSLLARWREHQNLEDRAPATRPGRHP
jgi:DNA-binding transcriptional regulator GbsR (MarR family)